MNLHTEVCDLLNIKYPLLQGAMAWIAVGKLAGAVSQAGGLGIIGTGDADAKWLTEQINSVRGITSNPFGVNLMLTSPHVEEVIEVLVKEQVPVVTTGGGNPGRYMQRLKDAGIIVIPVVSSVALAKRLSRLGADAIIAEGTESGGHVGVMTTMCLVPMVVDAVTVPVIAAGGIADGRGVIAAMALGAAGVQMGTRFICATECNVHLAYQQKVVKSKDRDTVVCGTTTGHPVRAIHNSFTRLYTTAERQGAPVEQLMELGKGRYSAASLQGDLDNGSILAGQICGLVHSIQPAAEIIEDIMKEAHLVGQRLAGGN
ncbi:MAG TPA: enoyl-[acyl-carrier-protein] reductase FabK [Syntrophomonas sp.]|nr:enoyl-[acyl-carrier-protein] reductase FabK [Syntrophomonas sp.]